MGLVLSYFLIIYTPPCDKAVPDHRVQTVANHAAALLPFARSSAPFTAPDSVNELISIWWRNGPSMNTRTIRHGDPNRFYAAISRRHGWQQVLTLRFQETPRSCNFIRRVRKFSEYERVTLKSNLSKKAFFAMEMEKIVCEDCLRGIISSSLTSENLVVWI